MFAIQEKIDMIHDEADIKSLIENNPEVCQGLCKVEAIENIYQETIDNPEYNMNVPLLRLRAKIIKAVTDKYLNPEDRPQFASSLYDLIKEYGTDIPLDSSVSSLCGPEGLEGKFMTNSVFGALLYEVGIFNETKLREIIIYLLQNIYTEGIITVFRDILIPMAKHSAETKKYVTAFKDDLFKGRIVMSDLDLDTNDEQINLLKEFFLNN